MAAPEPRPGRPIKKSCPENKRFYVGGFVGRDLRQHLVTAAARNGRSLSSQIEVLIAQMLMLQSAIGYDHCDISEIKLSDGRCLRLMGASDDQ
jgi:hypothetical protein